MLARLDLGVLRQGQFDHGSSALTIGGKALDLDLARCTPAASTRVDKTRLASPLSVAASRSRGPTHAGLTIQLFAIVCLLATTACGRVTRKSRAAKGATARRHRSKRAARTTRHCGRADTLHARSHDSAGAAALFAGRSRSTSTSRAAGAIIYLHGQDLNVTQASRAEPAAEEVTGLYTQVHDTGVAKLTFEKELAAGQSRRCAYRSSHLQLRTRRADVDERTAARNTPGPSSRRSRPAAPSRASTNPRFKTPFDIALTARPTDAVVYEHARAVKEEKLDGGLKNDHVRDDRAVADLSHCLGRRSLRRRGRPDGARLRSCAPVRSRCAA